MLQMKWIDSTQILRTHMYTCTLYTNRQANKIFHCKSRDEKRLSHILSTVISPSSMNFDSKVVHKNFRANWLLYTTLYTINALMKCWNVRVNPIFRVVDAWLTGLAQLCSSDWTILTNVLYFHFPFPCAFRTCNLLNKIFLFTISQCFAAGLNSWTAEHVCMHCK